MNSDGCSRGNPGESGGGSILRNENGHLLWAQGDYYGNNTNMVAEAKALLQGIQLCVEQGYVNVDIEVNSMILVQVLQNQIHTPWTITYEIRRIKHLMQDLNFRLSHTNRENNADADYMANLGCSLRKHVLFHSSNVPRKLRGIVRTNCCGLPNIRLLKL